MKNVLVVGSTGMIGSLILQKCLQLENVAKITSITRRKINAKHSKLSEVIHSDFLNFDVISEYFKNIDVCFFCLGVYTGTVSREEFRKITVEYTIAFAKVLKKQSPNSSFCFLSGQGADQTEKSSFMFAKDKGIAENFLISLHFPQTHIFRPGYIYPVTPRKEPNLLYRFMRVIYPFLNVVYRNGVITSEKLSNAIVDIGLNGGNKTVYENKELRERSEVLK